MSREAEYRDLIRDAEQTLALLPAGDDLMTTLMRMEAVDTIERNQSELRRIAADHLELHLSSRLATGHTVPMRILSRVLTKLQTTLDFAMWAYNAGPGVEGKVPTAMARSAEANVLAFAPGSVNVVIERSDRTLDGSFGDVLSSVLGLAKSASMGALGEPEQAIAASLGKNTVSRLAQLFRTLGEEHIDLEVERSGQQILLSPEASLDLSRWLDNVDQQVERVRVVGELLSADIRNGRLVLRTDQGIEEDARAAPPEQLHRIALNRRYEAVADQVSFISTRTGRRTRRLTVVSLHLVQDVEGTDATTPGALDPPQP